VSEILLLFYKVKNLYMNFHRRNSISVIYPLQTEMAISIHQSSIRLLPTSSVFGGQVKNHKSLGALYFVFSIARKQP